MWPGCDYSSRCRAGDCALVPRPWRDAQGEGESARSWLLSAQWRGPGRVASQQVQAQAQRDGTQHEARRTQQQEPTEHVPLPAQQQQPRDPPEQGSATSSATERAAQLLEQAAQEAGRAVLERAQLQQQLGETTAQAEQAARQVATLREQLAAKDAQLQRLSERQQQHVVNEQATSISRVEGVTAQQQRQLLALAGDEAACRSALLPVHPPTRH